jgi:hypothetical protein
MRTRAQGAKGALDCAGVGTFEASACMRVYGLEVSARMRIQGRTRGCRRPRVLDSCVEEGVRACV